MASDGKSGEKSSPSRSAGSPEERESSSKSSSKKVKIKKIVLKENGRSLVDRSDEDDEEQLRKFSSTSIKTGSKIVNDVIYDLSSLSSGTMANIELSDVDKQKIDEFKKRHRQRRAYSFRGFRRRLVFD